MSVYEPAQGLPRFCRLRWLGNTGLLEWAWSVTIESAIVITQFMQALQAVMAGLVMVTWLVVGPVCLAIVNVGLYCMAGVLVATLGSLLVWALLFLYYLFLGIQTGLVSYYLGCDAC